MSRLAYCIDLKIHQCFTLPVLLTSTGPVRHDSDPRSHCYCTQHTESEECIPQIKTILLQMDNKVSGSESSTDPGTYRHIRVLLPRHGV